MTRYSPSIPGAPDPEQTRDLHEPRARRYAEALATAAAAEEQIKALTEQLAEHEWHRTQAEAQVDYLRERLELGDHQLITGTDDEPLPEYVQGLIDLTTGQAWVRPTYNSGEPVPNAWIKADASVRGQTRYEWPISDAGPFLALPDSWALDKINREARRRDETEDAVHQLLRDHTAYRDSETSSWTRPSLEEAVARVYRHEQTARINADSRVRQLRQAIAAQIREPYDRVEVENPADESVDEIEVVTVEALRLLLERDAEEHGR